jgi:3-deoxy-D-manno-octulosonate 8-phosphate phosphatase (KDO 8-P phosphatase)
MPAFTDIRCLVLDVDGVLTDGRLWYGEGGEPLRAFHIHDGLAIQWFQRLVGDVVVLTAKTAASVRTRVAELGAAELIEGSDDKGRDFAAICERRGLVPDQVAAMGDDLTDLPMLTACGYPMAPANAVQEVRQLARCVTKRQGGDGAVREAIEHLLRAMNRWPDVVAFYEKRSAEEAAGRDARTSPDEGMTR